MSLLFGNYYLDLLSLLIALLSILVSYFKYCYGYWSRKGVYSIPPDFPFGNFRDAFIQKKTMGECFQDLYKHFKSKGLRYGGCYIYTNKQLLLIDPDLVKAVMAKDFAYFSDRATVSNVEKEPLTGHLLSLAGNRWKSMRRKLTPTFTSGKIKMMFQTILACADGLEQLLDRYSQQNNDIDVKDIFGRYTTDIIGSCAFGLDCNSMNDSNSEFRYFGSKFFKPSTLVAIKRIFLKICPNLFYYLKLRVFDKDITDFFTKVVVQTIEYREKNKIQRNDFLQLLINIRNTGNVDAKTKNEGINNAEINGNVEGEINRNLNEEIFKNSNEQIPKIKGQRNYGDGLTMDEITAQCFIFFLAGFETSATTMTYFLYDVSLDQEVQEKVRNEINEMLERYDGKLTYDGIMELHYLEKALLETMRLHAFVPFLDRRCTKNYKIPDSDVVIEEGTTIFIPVYGLQSDPEYYPEPEKYNPERFSSEERAKRHAFTFLPFGEGPRICIGQRFALLEIKVGLVVLLRNHIFKPSKKMEVPLKIDPKGFQIFQPKGGIWLNVERI